MADWPTTASLATAGGTLVLAAATYTSVRQGQRSTAIAERSTQIAERALLIGTRPVLIPARATDREERVGFTEGLQVVVANGMAAVEQADHNYYFAIPLHNVGTGLAVLHAWRVSGLDPREHPDHAAPETFRPQILDLYVPAGDSGYWQGAIRERDDPFREGLDDALARGGIITADLLYGDHEGGQRTISRFILDREQDGGWRCRVVHHWILDRPDPRPR
jgi:hypothetical protein